MVPDRSPLFSVIVLRAEHPGHLWIDLNQADKKMIACALLAGIVPYGWCLIPLYCLHLTGFIMRRASRRAVCLAPAALPTAAGLRLLKAAALSCGRISGSIHHRVLCI